MRRVLSLVLLLALATTAHAAPPAWGPATPITGATGTDYRLKGVTTGLSGNGDAVIGYINNSGFGTFWTRASGAWAKQTPSWSFLDSIVTAMNDKGDIAVAGISSASTFPGYKVYVGYKPAGAPWQLPDTSGYVDSGGAQQIPPTIAINDSGAVIVGWGKDNGLSTPPSLRSVYRPAGAASSWGTVRTLAPSDTHATYFTSGDSDTNHGAFGMALDNSGNALAVYSREYAEVKDKNNSDRGAYGLNQATSAAGGDWGAPTTITPQPFSGFPETPTPAVIPDFFDVTLAGDPATGVVHAAYVGDNYTKDTISSGNPLIYFATGSTGGIPVGSSSGKRGGSVKAAAHSGSYAFVGQVSPNPGDGNILPEATDGVGQLLPIGPAFTDYHYALAVAAGKDMAVAGHQTTLYIRDSTGAWTGTGGVWSIGSNPYYPRVAANCRGDALAAMYMATPGQLYVSDYLSGTTDACGGAAPGATVTPTATGTATATATVATTPTASPVPTASTTSGPAPTPAPDTTAPAAKLPGKPTVAGKQAAFKLGTFAEPVTGTLTLKPGGIASFKAAAGTPVTVKVKLSKAVRKQLRKHKVKTKLTLVVRDAAGNTTRKTGTAKLHA